MRHCKNCGHSLKNHKKEGISVFCDKIVGLGICCCINPEPEPDKKPITQILSEIQEWKEVE